MSDYFKEKDGNSDFKPLMMNWGFTISGHNAEVYRERGECYKIGEFVLEYIKSVLGKCDYIAVPDAINLSGYVFGHNKFPDRTYITTTFIKTIRVVERDGIGTLYHATTESGRSYYFNSEGTDKLFDWHMNRAVASLNSIIDPNSSIIPLCILSEED